MWQYLFLFNIHTDLFSCHAVRAHSICTCALFGQQILEISGSPTAFAKLITKLDKNDEKSLCDSPGWLQRRSWTHTLANQPVTYMLNTELLQIELKHKGLEARQRRKKCLGRNRFFMSMIRWHGLVLKSRERSFFSKFSHLYEYSCNALQCLGNILTPLELFFIKLCHVSFRLCDFIR